MSQHRPHASTAPEDSTEPVLWITSFDAVAISGVVVESLKLARAFHQSAHQVFLEVRPSNPVAHALYLAAGFREIGRRPRYYPAKEGREEAIVMTLELARPGPLPAM